MLDKLKSIDLKHYPDIFNLPEERQKIFLAMHVIREEVDVDYVTPGQLQTVLSGLFRYALPWQRIKSILMVEKNTVIRKQIKGKAHFSLMQSGIDAINERPVGSVTMIDPSTAFSGVRRIQEILSELTGSVLICDPYVDGKTLDYLTAISSKDIKLLTMNINHPSPFKRDLLAFQSQYGNLEIRVIENKGLHDRYILDDKLMLLLGQSLNGIGKKQTFVVQLGMDIYHQAKASFNKYWNTSTVFR